MSYTAIENTPIVVDLVQATKDTGWSISGDVAIHTSCNTGNIQLRGFAIEAGHTYQISYQVISISSGFVQMHAGTATGVSRTTAGSYLETITATGANPILYFTSNANCQIKAFNIRDTFVDTSNTQQNTIAYSPVISKWTSFYTMAPDYGFSMFIRTLVFQYGILYSQQNGSTNRNYLLGTQYQSLFKLIEAKEPAMIKSYNSLVLQANELLVTTAAGITTSLGQVSELSDLDFLKSTLTNGATSVRVYAQEGVYSASMLNDINSYGGLINGTPLKGNFIIIELTTIDGSVPMALYTVAVNTSISKIGAR
jgi:hypothetical protein